MLLTAPWKPWHGDMLAVKEGGSWWEKKCFVRERNHPNSERGEDADHAVQGMHAVERKRRHTAVEERCHPNQAWKKIEANPKIVLGKSDRRCRDEPNHARSRQERFE
eukprot:Gb_35147 [translate_table: standard]